MRTTLNGSPPRWHNSQEIDEDTGSCQYIWMSVQASYTVIATNGRLGTVDDLSVSSRRCDATRCRGVPIHPYNVLSATVHGLAAHTDGPGRAASPGAVAENTPQDVFSVIHRYDVAGCPNVP